MVSTNFARLLALAIFSFGCRAADAPRPASSGIAGSGRFVVKPKFAEARSFSEGLAAVRDGGKWGYIERTGDWAISPQFDEANEFSGGLAVVGFGEGAAVRYGYVDRQGRLVINPTYRLAYSFVAGFALASTDDPGSRWAAGTEPRFSIIDGVGRTAASGRYAEWLWFSEHLLPVRSDGSKSGLVGFQDTLGRWVVPPTFHRAWSFSDGLALVEVGHGGEGPGGKNGYIDRQGRVVISPVFDGGDEFSEGLAGVRVADRWGFIDKTGRFVVEPQFERVMGFSEGLAAVGVGFDSTGAGGRWGFIDRRGRMIINPRFGDGTGWAVPSDFAEGLSAVPLGERFGYIDKGGRLVVSALFEAALPFSEGLAAVKVGGKYGFIAR